MTATAAHRKAQLRKGKMCERLGCTRRFHQNTLLHRFCSKSCRLTADAAEVNAQAEARSMAPITRARRRLLTCITVSAWSLEQRRPANWNSWVECLGLPEAMKEAA